MWSIIKLPFIILLASYIKPNRQNLIDTKLFSVNIENNSY